MTKKNNSLLVEVSDEDGAYVEALCSSGAYTFASLFSHMLGLYKRSLNEPLRANKEAEDIEEIAEIKPKKNKKGS